MPHSEGGTADLAAFASARNSIRLVMGRSPLGTAEIESVCRLEVGDQVRRLVATHEFKVNIEAPIALTGYPPAGYFEGEPSDRFLTWVEGAVPLTSTTRSAVERSNDWREVLASVWSDVAFRRLLEPGTLSAARIDRVVAGLRWSLPGGGKASEQRAPRTRSVIREGGILVALGPAPRSPHAHGTLNLLATLRSLGGLRTQGAGFVATEQDPQMIFGPLDPGLYRLRLSISYHAYDESSAGEFAQLFVALGGDYREENSLRFPIRRGRAEADVVLGLESPVDGVRLDPSSGRSSFRIETFTIGRV